MDRRRVLTLGAGAVATAWLAGCGTGGGSSGGPGAGSMDGVETLTYGDDPAQLLELSRPNVPSRGVVVVIHGGFWRQEFDLSLGRPLAASLAGAGWTVANLEYRRVGGGGGWPQTFDDVAAGIDALADVDGLDTSTVITLGHSAGGHLAVWAAGRGQQQERRWADPRVAVTAAVSQAGVLDLRTGRAEGLGGGAVEAFVGGDDARYPAVDPLQQLPLPVPVRCIHGTDDANVPLSQSTTYVEAAVGAGADAELVEVEGDHFVVIDTGSAAWERTLQLLDDLA